MNKEMYFFKEMLFIYRIFYDKNIILLFLFGYIFIYFSFISTTNTPFNEWVRCIMDLSEMNLFLSGFIVSIFNTRKIENRVLHNILANFSTKEELFFSWNIINYILVILFTGFSVALDYFVLRKASFIDYNFPAIIIFLFTVSFLYLMLIELISFTMKNSVVTIISSYLILQALLYSPLSWRYFSLISISYIIMNIISTHSIVFTQDFINLITINLSIGFILFLISWYSFVKKGEFD